MSLLTPPPSLNLPSADLTLRAARNGVEVYDVLRGKWIVMTSEEWVRQHFVHFLAKDMGYPSSLMANEVAITLNSMSRRCDTVIYNSALEPMMIVEYKAPSVKIGRKVFEQILRYNMVLRVPYLVVSNGLNHYCLRVDTNSGKCEALSEIPLYNELYM